MIKKDQAKVSKALEARNEAVVFLMDRGHKSALVSYIFGISRQAVEKIYVRVKAKDQE